MDTDTLRRLIQKYDRPGPRYTSYPTAVQFTDTVDPDALAAAASRTDQPRSIYVHLPFCETLCWFCGCFTIITKDHDRANGYLDSVQREIELYAAHDVSPAPVNQLHFGGGTPNFLNPDQILRLGDVLHRNYAIQPDAECSVELAPLRLTRAHIEAFHRIGVRRASFGVQDVDPQVQAAINRRQPEAVNRRTVDDLRDTGYTSINIDLMYGLPHQTPDSFDRTLDSILELDPDRLAVFNYAHVPWMRPAQQMLEKAGLPDPSTKLEILLRMVERLTSEGFEYIGMDHFARPGDELAAARRSGNLQRNFQGYSTRAGGEILAFGVSAIGQTDHSYRQNTKDLQHYASSIAEGRFPVERGIFLTADDRIRRHLIHRLMCDLHMDTSTVLAPFGTSFPDHFGDWRTLFSEFLEDGLVQSADTPESFRVTDLGRFFLRNLAMVFDAYLSESGQNRFSRTI